MNIIFTTNTIAHKEQLHNDIDSLNEHINMLISIGDYNLVELYKERLNLLIDELFELTDEQ